MPQRAKELSEIVKRYRDFFKLSQQPMWVCDSETLRVLSVNQAAINHYGYSAKEFLRLRISDIRPQEDIPKFKVALVTDDVEKPSFSGVWRHLKKDGSVIEVEVHSHRIRYAGRQARWAIITDVTDRMSAERKLRKSEERLAAALQASGLGVYDSDYGTDILNWDARMRDIWGIKEDQPVTVSLFQEGIHSEDRARVSKEIQVARSTLGTHHYVSEFRVINRLDGSERWVRAEGTLTASEGSIRNLGTVTDITERRRAEEKINLLIREVNHRSKNLLAVVQSIACQTANKSNPAEFASTFTKRLQGLSASHDLLVKCDWQGVSLSDLVSSQLLSFSISDENWTSEGPYISLTPQATQAIGMALHELATNSAKYGALSRNGQIRIRWITGPDGLFRMEWTEAGGPEVSPPEHKGFGTTLIQQMTAITLGGTVTLDYKPQGLKCEITAPLELLTGTKCVHRAS